MSEGARALSVLGLPFVIQLLAGIMFDFWHVVKYIWSVSTCKQSRGFELYLHVNIVWVQLADYF